jgi:hypothetical protein
MRKTIVVLALVAMAGAAFAAQLDVADARPLGMAPAIGAARDATVVYSDVTTVTAAYSRANPPAEEIGDELLMTSGGILDTLKFSVYNGTAAGTTPGDITTADLALKFYNFDAGTSTFVLAGTLNYTGATLNLAPTYYTIVSLTGLATNNIVLTDDVLATLTISNITGGATRAGQVLANPPTIGSSTNDFYRGGSWYWFGSTGPIANFAWEIGVVPEPASLLLIAVGALALRRR